MNEIEYRKFYEKVGNLNGWDFSQLQIIVGEPEWDYYHEVKKRFKQFYCTQIVRRDNQSKVIKRKRCTDEEILCGSVGYFPTSYCFLCIWTRTGLLFE